MQRVVPTKRTRVSAPKKKTGCKTCKIRRIKCDEGRPGCERCARFGEDCDGYPPVPLTKAERAATLRQREISEYAKRPLLRAPTTKLFENDHEYQCFRHFSNETAIQLTGSFETDLWSRLVLQSSEFEPCIRHAVTAVGALNLQSPVLHDELESTRRKFAYLEYGKAIALLRKSINDGLTNLRTKLIASLLFACFESYHGNNDLVASHVFSAIQMLYDYSKLRSKPISRLMGPPTEEDIILTLGVLEISCASYYDPRPPEVHLAHIHSSESMVSSMPEVFRTLKEAWSYVGLVMLRAIHYVLLKRATRSKRKTKAVPALFDMQSIDHCGADPDYLQLCRHLNEFRRWHKAFEPLLKKSRTTKGKAIYRAAMIHEIAYFTCYLWIASAAPSNMPYIHHAPELAETLRLVKILIASEDQNPNDQVYFSLDVRLVLPLMGISFHYKHRADRREAIHILKTMSPQRDGIWDSQMLGAVARYIAEIEEVGLGNEIYVPEERVVTVSDMKIDMARRETFLACLVPVGPDYKQTEIRETIIHW